MDFTIWSWEILVMVMEKIRVNQIMDDLDFSKRTLDLTRIWLRANQEVHKFTYLETIVLLLPVIFVNVMFDSRSASTNLIFFCKTTRRLAVFGPPNRLDAQEHEGQQ